MNTPAPLATRLAYTTLFRSKFGNLLTNDNTDQVTLSASGPGGIASGGTATTSGGIATFGSLVLNTAGSYTLTATGPGGVTGPASSSFTISPAAAASRTASGRPSNKVAGVAITQAVTVKVVDKFGNLLTNDNTDQVTLSASGPGGIASGGTATTSGGIATFGSLVLNTAGSYTLTDTGPGGVTGPASSSFTISPAAA